MLLQGAQIGTGAEPHWPPHFNHCYETLKSQVADRSVPVALTLSDLEMQDATG